METQGRIAVITGDETAALGQFEKRRLAFVFRHGHHDAVLFSVVPEADVLDMRFSVKGESADSTGHAYTTLAGVLPSAAATLISARGDVMKLAVAESLMIAAMAVLPLAVHAQTTKWDMPTPYSDGEFHTVNVKLFAADVRKATNNQLDINVHSNGSLIKHPDMLRAVSVGQVSTSLCFGSCSAS